MTPQSPTEDFESPDPSVSEGEALLSELPPVLHTPEHKAPRLFQMTRPVKILFALLGLIIVGLSGFAIYLYNTSNAWQERALEMRSNSQTLGEQVGQLRDELTTTKHNLENTVEQLETAKERINQLADEKARSDDDRAVQQQLISIQQRISLKASQVTDTYDQCVQGTTALVGYYQEIDQYDPADVLNFADRVKGICDFARESHGELLNILEELES